MDGQYHYIVNLDKREFLNPHRLGGGLKAFEQMRTPAGTPQALFVLLMCSNGRGEGDLAEPRGSERVIGRWVGDRIAVIGDGALDCDIKAPLHDRVSEIYGLCIEGVYREISDLVRPVLAAELGVVFTVEPMLLQCEDGSEGTYNFWRIERDASARYSVLRHRR